MKYLLFVAVVGLAACSSKTISTDDLDKLNTQFTENQKTIAEQEQEIVKLREDLRHESAEIDVKDAQSERLYIGPRLGSPY